MTNSGLAESESISNQSNRIISTFENYMTKELKFIWWSNRKSVHRGAHNIKLICVSKVLEIIAMFTS